MTMTSAFKDELCAEFTTRVDHLSLHTTDPGTVGDNDSDVTHVELDWTTPVDGTAYATAAIANLTGDYTHIGLWGGDDTEYRMAVPCEIHFTTAADVSIMVVHEVNQGVFLAAVDPA